MIDVIMDHEGVRDVSEHSRNGGGDYFRTGRKDTGLKKKLYDAHVSTQVVVLGGNVPTYTTWESFSMFSVPCLGCSSLLISLQ